MPKRTYKLTEKQKRAALKWYKKGYTTHGKLSKKLGISRQKVSNWLKQKKIGKRAVGGAKEFWTDVKAMKGTLEISREKAIKKVKYGAKWFKRRQARLKGVAKARDEMRQKWHKIKEGEIEKDWWKEEKGEGLIDFAGYD
ncbi:hypothetical protein KAW50_05030 [candidate division WOR-3 bacterium]|nr:hypothetical protein [candidate division WOR-3 bacterium]